MNTELDLLCWCWKYSLLGRTLKTTDGKSVEVTDPGLYNRNRYGQFFNAKVRIDGCLFVGSIQILDHACHWQYHGKDIDPESQNVILVVVNHADGEIFLQNGEKVTVIQAEVPESIRQNAWTLLEPVTGQASCKGHVMEYTTHLSRHAWLSAMQTEWLEESSDYLRRFYEECGKDMNQTAFVALLRGFGFFTNKVTMDLLARSIPLDVLMHYRDDLFQIEAIIFGQAGLLNICDNIQNSVPDKFMSRALNEGYFEKLRREWVYLSKKYSMPNPVSILLWHPYGSGKLTYPHVILSILANMVYTKFSPNCFVDRILELESHKEAKEFLNGHCTAYWECHFNFGAETKKCSKSLSDDRINSLILTFIVPFQFFYGRVKCDEKCCDNAFDIMEQTPAFQTPAVRKFCKVGMNPECAGDSIALQHLQSSYCNSQDCLRCRFGFEFIKKH